MDSCAKASHNQWARALKGGEKGLHIETAQAALTVISNLVMRRSDQNQS